MCIFSHTCTRSFAFFVSYILGLLLGLAYFLVSRISWSPAFLVSCFPWPPAFLVSCFSWCPAWCPAFLVSCFLGLVLSWSPAFLVSCFSWSRAFFVSCFSWSPVFFSESLQEVPPTEPSRNCAQPQAATASCGEKAYEGMQYCNITNDSLF
jgi:hypothetical protein